MRVHGVRRKRARDDLAAGGFSSKPATRPAASKRKIPIWVASAAVTGWAAIVMSARRSMCDSTSSA